MTISVQPDALLQGLNVLINHRTLHGPAVDTSAGVTQAADQKVSITVKFQEFCGGAVMQLGWPRPGGAGAPVQATQLLP